MAEESSRHDPPRPFDVRTVEYLLKLMSEHELSEIDLREGEQRIRLRKGPLGTAALPYPSVIPPYVPASSGSLSAPSISEQHARPTAAPPASSTAADPPAAAIAATSRKIHEIRSPMVGTFYAKPKPDKPDYVSVGSRVSPDTVVCQIEAMKLFNEITADCTGTIIEVCVKNGDFVEYNQVLFRVELSQ